MLPKIFKLSKKNKIKKCIKKEKEYDFINCYGCDFTSQCERVRKKMGV